ncbi:endo alpha-1,4 polygalactosaminidase [Actinoplanes couchii]|nr:endo alpha-1,4 polygalactosaminidase [Actinoplanes couchii]MDR6320248.1 hypothetical protein [Actinoplanes couchii]
MAFLSHHLISGVSAVSLTLTGAFALAPAAQAAPSPAPAFAPPPVNATVDYQIGEAYPPPAGVTVVTRDRNDRPVAGLYNLCYVNAFQTQPDETDWWKLNHDNLLLKDKRGRYVEDPDWGETLLDTSTPAKREALAGIVGGWITGCAAAGFKAVEPDNIDSYSRSKGLLTKAGAVAYLQLLATRSHAAGLAIAQKNSTELGTAGKAAGLDFVVAEQCGEYDECRDYTSVYGNNVIDIEYTNKGFTKACASIGAQTSVIRRDVNVTAPGSRTYKYQAC